MSDDGVMSYFAKFGLDASGFLNGIQQSQTGVLSFYRDVSVSMAASMMIFDKVMAYGQKFIELSNQAMEYVSTIDKLSVTTGMSTEELQRWTNVARYADSDITSLSMSINKMQMNLSAQGAAGDDVRKMLDDMGVSYRNVDGSLKSSSELFPAIIEGLKGLESSSDRVTAANAIFGRSYQSLAGYMNMSETEMTSYFSHAGILTDEQTGALGEYENATKDLNKSVTELSHTAGAELAPSFTEFSELINGLADNEGIIAFFSALNDFLTLVARGFHIMGSEARVAYELIFNRDIGAARQEAGDLAQWISQKTRDDAMRAAGYKTDGMGNVILDEKATTSKIKTTLSLGIDEEAIQAAEEAQKKLNDTTEDYADALGRINDELKGLTNTQQDYIDNMQFAVGKGDVAAVRELSINYKQKMRADTGQLDTAYMNAQAAGASMVAAGGTVGGNTFNVTVNASKDYPIDQIMKDLEKYQNRQRIAQGINLVE